MNRLKKLFLDTQLETTQPRSLGSAAETPVHCEGWGAPPTIVTEPLCDMDPAHG